MPHTRGMLTLTQNLSAQDNAAEHKVHAAAHFFPYLTAAALAGGSIGLADVFMMTAGGPLKVAGNPWGNLIIGAVFGIGLILTVFAGGELATSGMMILPIGAIRKRVSALRATLTLFEMLIGNLIGSIVVAALVWGSQIMAPDTVIGQFLQTLVHAKVSHSASELFFRGILCNILVCLAMWCVTRCENEVAKILIMGWCMAAFVASGFEHVVANMTTLSLGFFYGLSDASLLNCAYNIVIVGAGNIVGGMVFVAGTALLTTSTEKD